MTDKRTKYSRQDGGKRTGKPGPYKKGQRQPEAAAARAHSREKPEYEGRTPENRDPEIRVRAAGCKAGGAEDKAADNGFRAMVEGRNAVAEAVKSGRRISRIIVQEGVRDQAVLDIIAGAEGMPGMSIEYADRKQMDSMSETGRHQGIIAFQEAYAYAGVSDILARAERKNEPPFIFILDGIEDPHNLGAIVRTANLSGAHGVIVREDRAAGLTAVVARASAGAINYTPVARVTNIARTIDKLKEAGMWFVCADMGGRTMYELDLTGAIGLVIGNEGSGVSELVRKKCDMTASIPMFGDIDSLNASVAAGVLAYEVVRQRMGAHTVQIRQG